jgi:hypothetical protein
MWRIGPTGTLVVHSPANFWIVHAATACINCSALYVFLIYMLLRLIICVLKMNLSLGEHLATTVSHELTHRFSQLYKQGVWITCLSCNNSKFCVICVVACTATCEQNPYESHKNETRSYAYSIQVINNYGLTLRTAHYYIILVSQHCNLILIILYIFPNFNILNILI